MGDHDDHVEELLEENTKLAKENNKLLKKMYRSIQWGRIFRLLYWTAIIAAGFGAYYFIQPYIVFLQESLGFSEGSGVFDSLNQILRDPSSLLEQRQMTQ